MSDQTLTIEEAVAGAMAQIGKRPWGAFISDEDARQEMWVWAYEHVTEVNTYLESYGETPGWSYNRLRGKLLGAAQRYAERERAEFNGSNTDDQVYYKPAQVFSALKAALDGSVVTGAGVVSEVRSPTDPAEGGGLLAMSVDAKRAWESAPLSTKEREAVILFQVLDMALEDVSDLMKIPTTSVKTLVRRGGWKLVNFLGGESPWSSTDDKLRERP